MTKQINSGEVPENMSRPSLLPTLPMPIDIRSVARNRPAPLDFVLPGFLHKTCGMLIATGGTGKSFLALQTAFTVACGFDYFRVWGNLAATGDVLYLAIEDPPEALNWRVHNAMKHISEEFHQDRIAEGVRILPLYGTGFKLATLEERRVIASSWIDAILRDCEQFGAPRLIIIDTQNRALAGLDENDNAQAGEIVSILEQVSRAVGAAMLIVHHVSKGSAREGRTDAAAARGASAFVDNSRFVIAMATMTEADAELHGIGSDARRDWVKIDGAKTSYSANSGEMWLQRRENGFLWGVDQPQPVLRHPNVRSFEKLDAAARRLAARQEREAANEG